LEKTNIISGDHCILPILKQAAKMPMTIAPVLPLKMLKISRSYLGLTVLPHNNFIKDQ
jgi:hypothetical protein